MKSRKIKLILQLGESIRQIDAIKIKSVSEYNRIKDKIEHIDGILILPKTISENVLFVDKNGNILEKLNDECLFTIKSNTNLLNEIKRHKIKSIKNTRNEYNRQIVDEQEKILEPSIIIKKEEKCSLEIEAKKTISLPEEITKTPTETIVPLVVPIVPPLVLIEKKEPTTTTTIIEQEDNLDKTLSVVLENIQKSNQVMQLKKQEDSEMEKLKLELMKKKLELINNWIEANKAQ